MAVDVGRFGESKIILIYVIFERFIATNKYARQNTGNWKFLAARKRLNENIEGTSRGFLCDSS